MPKRKPAPPELRLLDADELALLRAFPYESPGKYHGSREAKIVERLVGQGLLERHPDDPRTVRCTEAGEAERLPLSRAALERLIDQVRELAADDPESAASLERALWLRALAEMVGHLEASAQGRSAAYAVGRAALRTLHVHFGR